MIQPLRYEPKTDSFSADWELPTKHATEESLRVRSPGDKYELVYEFKCTGGERPQEVGRCEITEVETGVVKAILFRDHYTEPAFSWIVDDANCILFWASTYCQGYEVIDFVKHELTHVEDGDNEDFIVLQAALSPDKNQLAVSGCHWACPYEIKILDVRRPLMLPLNVIASFDYEEGELVWTGARTVSTRKDGEIAVEHHLPTTPE